MAQLLDASGRPVRTAELRREQAGPTLTGVRQVLSGHPAQGLTPKRLAALLREAEDGDPTRYLELAEEMEEKDLHYLSAISTRKRQVAQLAISVEPGDDSSEAAEHAKLVEEWVSREELQDELVDVLDAVGKGFSATEIIWETSERQWRPARLEWRFPQWFRFDRTDGKTLMLLGETGIEEPLAPFKFIVHQAKVKAGLAIRGGLARAAAWAYLFKNYDIKDWVGFVEVYGQPIRVGKYHPGATEDEKDVLLKAVASIGTDAAAIVPSTMLIEFVRSEAAREHGDLYEKLALYLDRQVSKAVLGQTLTSEPGDSGSRALGEVHDVVREDIERSDAKQLAATLNRDAVRPMIDLNFGPQKVYPRLAIGRPEEENLEFVVKSVAELVPLGFRVGQRQMRQRLGFEEMAEDDTPLEAPAAPPAFARAERRGAGQRRPVRPGGVQDDVDRVTAKLERETRAQVEGLVDAVKGAVESAEDFSDLESRLGAVAGRFGVLDLADLIAQGLLLAELAGRDDIVEEAGGEAGADG